MLKQVKWVKRVKSVLKTCYGKQYRCCITETVYLKNMLSCNRYKSFKLLESVYLSKFCMCLIRMYEYTPIDNMYN